MITYYTDKDLASFGRYLLSDERKNRFRVTENDTQTVEEKMQHVYHADIENWKVKEAVSKSNQPCCHAGS